MQYNNSQSIGTKNHEDLPLVTLSICLTGQMLPSLRDPWGGIRCPGRGGFSQGHPDFGWSNVSFRTARSPGKGAACGTFGSPGKGAACGTFASPGTCQAAFAGDCTGKRPSAQREGQFRGRFRRLFGPESGSCAINGNQHRRRGGSRGKALRGSTGSEPRLPREAESCDAPATCRTLRIARISARRGSGPSGGACARPGLMVVSFSWERVAGRR